MAYSITAANSAAIREPGVERRGNKQKGGPRAGVGSPDALISSAAASASASAAVNDDAV
jgi:hypothetical protein